MTVFKGYVHQQSALSYAFIFCKKKKTWSYNILTKANYHIQHLFFVFRQILFILLIWIKKVKQKVINTQSSLKTASYILNPFNDVIKLPQKIFPNCIFEFYEHINIFKLTFGLDKTSLEISPYIVQWRFWLRELSLG